MRPNLNKTHTHAHTHTHIYIHMKYKWKIPCLPKRKLADTMRLMEKPRASANDEANLRLPLA